MTQQWRPSADCSALVARAALLAEIRQFFTDRHVLEVETPLLCRAGVTDPALALFSSDSSGDTRYLQTSPEYAMKRLLAAGVGDSYQICKAFRVGESGQRHNPEFTLLEWYRVGWDHRQLSREVATLLCGVLGRTTWQVWPYRALFQYLLDVDPFNDPLPRMLAVAQRVLGDIPDDLDRDQLLDLLMSLAIEPRIASWGVVFITDYPVSQAALARTGATAGLPVGFRFEAYVDGVEVANGYWEQGDAEELRRRFNGDNATRAKRGQPKTPVDEAMLGAHEAGLPDCAGVAMGLDRLLALRMGCKDIRDVLAFEWERA